MNSLSLLINKISWDLLDRPDCVRHLLCVVCAVHSGFPSILPQNSKYPLVHRKASITQRRLKHCSYIRANQLVRFGKNASIIAGTLYQYWKEMKMLLKKSQNIKLLFFPHIIQLYKIGKQFWWEPQEEFIMSTWLNQNHFEQKRIFQGWASGWIVILFVPRDLIFKNGLWPGFVFLFPKTFSSLLHLIFTEAEHV